MDVVFYLPILIQGYFAGYKIGILLFSFLPTTRFFLLLINRLSLDFSGVGLHGNR